MWQKVQPFIHVAPFANPNYCSIYFWCHRPANVTETFSHCPPNRVTLFCPNQSPKQLVLPREQQEILHLLIPHRITEQSGDLLCSRVSKLPMPSRSSEQHCIQGMCVFGRRIYLSKLHTLILHVVLYHLYRCHQC